MTKNVLSAEINHETNTFHVKPTTLDNYRRRRFLRGSEIRKQMTGTNTEIGAHIDAAEKFGWSLVQPLSAQATPSGRTDAETWSMLKDLVVGAGAGYDGVLLALHGAMVTQTAADAEVDLLTDLREKLGDAVPIAVTFDLHANLGPALADLANIVIAYRGYPHIDMHDRGMEAAELLNRTMEGEISPRTVVAKRPMIDGCDYGRTGGAVMPGILAKAEQMRRDRPSVAAVSVCAGFCWSDVPQVGPSVTVTCDGNLEAGREVAETLMDEIWERRHQTSVPNFGLEAAMEAAKAIGVEYCNGPLVLADFTDNPGSGAYGDGVRLLEAMIQAELPRAAFASIADGEAVSACIAAGIGQVADLRLGAKVDPETYGPPFKISARVVNITDGEVTLEGPMNKGVRFSCGPTAVIRVGGVTAVISTNVHQIYDRQYFVRQGIIPEEQSVLAVKSWHHFRAAFEPIACDVMLVDSGGLASTDLKRFPYKNVPRPVFPLDLD